MTVADVRGERTGKVSGRTQWFSGEVTGYPFLAVAADLNRFIKGNKYLL
jgi:hypothetical protein